MQTVLLAACTKGTSLRDAIAGDREGLEGFNLAVKEGRRKGRQPGWMKVLSTSPGHAGAANVEWDSAAQVLTCRIVTRGNGNPAHLLGELTGYLLQGYRRRIRSILVLPGREVKRRARRSR